MKAAKLSVTSFFLQTVRFQKIADQHVPRLRSSLVVFALLFSFAAVQTARPAQVTWDSDNATAGTQDGAGTWSTSANNWWNGSTDNVWNNGDSAIFGVGNGAAGNVTVGTSGITVSDITFDAAASGNYTINATGGNTLTLSGNPTITANADATLGLVLAGTGFMKNGIGNLSLNAGAINNTFSGPVVVNGGRLTLANGTDNILQMSSADLTINSGATVQFTTAGVFPSAGTIFVNGGVLTNANPTGSKLLQLNRLILDNNATVGAAFAQASMNLTNIDARGGYLGIPRFNAVATSNVTVKSTPGTFTVPGGANNAGSQGLQFFTINAGIVSLDYLNPGLAGDNANRGRIVSSGTFTLGGGTVRVNYSGSSGRTETTASTTVRPGATSFITTNNGASTFTLALSGITRNTGGTLDFRKISLGAGAANFTTTSANVNGIAGGWATFAGNDWAVGTSMAAYSAYTTSTDPTTWLATDNVSLSANPSPDLDDVTINSLRLTNGPTVTLNFGKTLTLSSGGLLAVGSNSSAITGGSLMSGLSGGDLIVHQYSSADLTIASALTDNGGSSLTKSGPGKLILTGTDNLTGNNFLNGGTVEVSDLAKLASGPLVMNNGVLRYTGSDASSSRTITVSGAGGTFDIPGSTKFTQTTAITGNGGVNSQYGGMNMGDWGGLTKIGSGTLVLATNNVYNGPTVVMDGVLSVNGTNSLTGTSGLTNYSGGGAFTVLGGSLGGTGTISGPVTVKNGGTISPGNSVGTLTLAGSLTLEAGSTNFFEVTNAPGANDQIIVQGNLTVSNSTMVIKVLGTTLQPGTYTLIQYSGTLSGSFNPTVVIASGAINGTTTIDPSTAGQVNLVVIPQVAITSQPADTIVSVGQDATFNVSASGSAPLFYQWYSHGSDANNTPTPKTDATNSSFTITNAQSSDSGFYSVVVTNSYNSVTSRVASLIVGNVIPVISGPTNKTVIAGNNVTFNVSVLIANPQPDLQWQTNGVDVAGATTSSLTLNNVQYGLNGTTISVIATNLAGSVTNSAILTVIVTPAISPQPTNITVNVGDPVVFTSGATGVPTPGLQWYKNGAVISGETGSTFTIASAQGSDNGIYTLVASNAAGVTTSSAARLIVYSTTLAATAFTPSNGASGVCVDTPLYITFNGTVGTVNAGKVRIYNTSNLVTPVDTIDVSTNQVITNGAVGVYNVQPRNVAGVSYKTFPVLLISGSTAAIYPHAGVLANNQTYFVTIDSGVFQDSSGAYFSGITNATTWQFTTKTTALLAGTTNIVVAADGSGDFCTVQGALDFLPAANTTPRTINIRNGVYQEIVYINAKNNLTFVGQNRDQTMITYVNNETLNSGTALRPGFRAQGNDLAFVNLTITNSTPKGGQQAEALRTDGRRIILLDVKLASFQDTMLNNNNGDLVYVQDSLIQGDTDFIWGLSTTFLTNCEIRTLSSGTQITQARTTAGTNGFSFVNCMLTRANAGVTGCGLGRSLGFNDGNVAYVGCLIDAHITGWLDSLPRSWEFGNSNITGTAAVTYNGVQLVSTDANLTNARTASLWLYGWQPQLSPQILTQPAPQSVVASATAVFNVSAVGIGSPSYQWLKNNTNLVGETSSSLTINNASANDVGTYSVIVSNAAGAVLSSSATLTINNTAPTLAPVSDETVNVGVTVNITNVVSDPDPQAFTFSLLTGPTNATLGASSGIFTWRPIVTQADTTNTITVSVTDDGSPNLSATNSFTIIVNPLTMPDISAPALVDGQFSLTVNGQAGPDYAVQVSTNLSSGIWTTLFTTNFPPMPFTFIDTNATGLDMQFYRIQVGPPLP